jgi:hypothetical protein
MSTVSMRQTSWKCAHEQFEHALSQMNISFELAFRHRRFQDRAEAIAEACACAWKAWYGLVKRGKDPVAVGVSGIARYAVRHVLKGRKIGNRVVGRGSMDVYHWRAQQARGFRVIPYADVELTEELQGVNWKDFLASSDKLTPADQAIFRIDFDAWLSTLSERKRRTAELLAAGHETGLVARMIGVTPAAVSMARPLLAASWRQFQGEEPGIPGQKRSHDSPKPTSRIPV